MTDVQDTITTAGQASSTTKRSTTRGRGFVSPGHQDDRAGRLTPRQAEVLDVLRVAGTQARAAEMLNVQTNTIHDVVKILRHKGAIGPAEYGKPAPRGRKVKPRAVRFERSPLSPHEIANAAIREARPHVIEAIRFALPAIRSRDGIAGKVSTLTCSCKARLRASGRGSADSHDQLASLWLEHKNGRPIAHGRGPRDEHGRLIGEELPMV